jgi:hypothetical protein
VIGVAATSGVAPWSDHGEVAFEIVDQYQSRGLGTTLIDLLAQTALEHGVTSFIAYVEPDNTSVIRWAQKAGGSSSERVACCASNCVAQSPLRLRALVRSWSGRRRQLKGIDVSARQPTRTPWRLTWSPRRASKLGARLRLDDRESALHAGIEVGFDGANDLICAYVRCREAQSLVGSGFDLVLDVDEIGEQLFLGFR